MSTDQKPLVAVIMGSRSDWPIMENAALTLDQLGVPYEASVISAHRTPTRMFDFAKEAEARGIEAIIAGAGGAAHLPGMVAAISYLPVLGVPINATDLNGEDALLSIVQMPKGVPVGTLAIGKSGAINAAILAAQFLGAKHSDIRANVARFRDAQSSGVPLSVSDN